MNPEKAFEKAKNEIVGDSLTITSLTEGFKLYDLFIELRSKLWLDGIIDIVPHYRGEQVFGWDIKSGIYRPPLSISDPKTAKYLEKNAVREFENVIAEKVGKDILRDIFNGQKHGKDWDLLFQGQHAGIKTTLTDWSALITTALFFATEESKIEGIENSDGQVWCFLAPSFCILGHELFPERKTFYDIDPFTTQTLYLINPAIYVDDIENRIFEYRMFKQNGRFIMPAAATSHIPLNKQDDLVKFIFQIKVPVEFKKVIRKELESQKITRNAMYVDETPEKQNLIDDINSCIFSLP